MRVRVLGTISLAVVFLLVAGSLGAYAQDRDDSRPGQAQEQKDKAKSNEKDKDKDKHEVNGAKQEQKHDHDQPGVKEERQDQDMSQQQGKQEKQEQKEQRSDQRMDRDQHQHSVAAKQGKHIPDDKFRAHFGRQHTFKVQRTQVINVSQRVVVYGGYNFQLVEAWPVDWGFDDDCYIDYVDGEYFLFNAFHPGIRIAVFVVG